MCIGRDVRTATRAAKTRLGEPPPNLVPVHTGAREADPLERTDGGYVLPVAGRDDRLDVLLAAGPVDQSGRSFARVTSTPPVRDHAVPDLDNPVCRKTLETSIADDRLRLPLDDDPHTEVRRLTIAARLKGQHVEQIALWPIRRQRRTEQRLRRRSITGEDRSDRGWQGPQLKPPSMQAEGHRNRLGPTAAGPAASLDVIARRWFA
jgi:hypothetical protein